MFPSLQTAGTMLRTDTGYSKFLSLLLFLPVDDVLPASEEERFSGMGLVPNSPAFVGERIGVPKLKIDVAPRVPVGVVGRLTGETGGERERGREISNTVGCMSTYMEEQQ